MDEVVTGRGFASALKDSEFPNHATWDVIMGI
jgi:hypothetical protein